jgi:hypothetical protein
MVSRLRHSGLFSEVKTSADEVPHVDKEQEQEYRREVEAFMLSSKKSMSHLIARNV